MRVSGADLCGFQSLVFVCGVGGVAHAHRNIRSTGGAVAELASPVVSPCVSVAVAAHGQRMISSGADLQVGEVLRQVRVRVAVGCLHPDRRIPVRVRPVAELATAVVSPGVGVTVAAQGQRMRVSGAYLHIGEIRGRAYRLTHFDRGSLAVAGRLVAELAFAVVSPCVGVPVAAQGQGKTIGV